MSTCKISCIKLSRNTYSSYHSTRHHCPLLQPNLLKTLKLIILIHRAYYVLNSQDEFQHLLPDYKVLCKSIHFLFAILPAGKSTHRTIHIVYTREINIVTTQCCGYSPDMRVINCTSPYTWEPMVLSIFSSHAVLLACRSEYCLYLVMP